MFSSIEDVEQRFRAQKYLCPRRVATAVFLACRLEKPLLVEGPAGVGKTELGKVLALALGEDLIRLQCYEGLDEAKALYEWEYAKQMLYTQILKDKIGEVIQDAGSLAQAVERPRLDDAVVFATDDGDLARGPARRRIDRIGLSALRPDDVVRPAIAVAVAQGIAADVTHHVTGRLLHVEEVPIAPAELLHDPSACRLAGSQVIHLRQTDHAVNGGIDPLAQIGGVVPAARRILMLAVVEPDGVIAVARR